MKRYALFKNKLVLRGLPHNTNGGLVMGGESWIDPACTHPFVDHLKDVIRKADERLARVCAKLKEEGVKAFHPDDGWVDRRRQCVTLVYPHFNLSPSVGDVIAIGAEESYRVAVVTRVEPYRVTNGRRRALLRQLGGSSFCKRSVRLAGWLRPVRIRLRRL